MASNVRQQMKNWIATLEIHGSVLDVGGLKCPVRGRTKVWDVSDYKILDLRAEWKGWKADYVADINYLLPQTVIDNQQFDNVFCTEVMEYMIDPMTAVKNLNKFLKPGGKLFLSTHFMYPYHVGGTDAMRFTRGGVIRLLEYNRFKILDITPRLPLDPKLFTSLIMRESKVCKYPQEVGHLTTAQKL